jgi:hypothetical protein
VKRFVVDECHQIITCDSYRSKFNAVKELAQFPVQKIYLTATLPVFLEDFFLQQVYLPGSTPIIREPTNRKNLMYHLLRVDQRARKVKDVVIDLARLVEKDLWTEGSRGIIFCLSRAEVDDLAKSFGNTKSHSDMEHSDRSEIQERWHEGLLGHRWMVATTGFIHGIDNPNVDTVIFIEMPYGLNNFVQGGGRAGRSGRTAHVFLLEYCTTFIQPRINDIDVAAVAAGTEFVENVSNCRRTIISNVMDGLPVCCGDFLDAVKCDNCNPNHPMIVAYKKLLLPVREDSPDYDLGGFNDATLGSLDPAILDATQPSSSSSLSLSSSLAPTMPSHPSSNTSLLLDQAIYLKFKQDKKGKVAVLTDLTKAVGGILDGGHTRYCIICWVWKKKRVPKTSTHQYFINCKTKEDGYITHAIGWIKLKKRFVFENYQYCWKCGLPQGESTPATHPIFKRSVILECPFDDLVILLIWYILHTEDVWRRACLAFPELKRTMPFEEITLWLKKEQPHMFYNGLELVIWFWITYKEALIIT